MSDGKAPRAERLQKFLARAGLGSRRACEELIAAGRVAVDGRVVTEMGVCVDPRVSRITVDGRQVRPQPLAYYLVNKPRGFLCTMDGDPSILVTSLVPSHVRVFPVGRLEADSEGLIILTNDGELAHRLAHPSFAASRVYRVELEGELTERALGRLQRGVYLAEGKTLPAELRVIRRERSGAVVELTIREGLNREVRRMLAAVGLKAKRIVRIRFARLSLGSLGPGEFRELSPEEVRRLREAVSGPPRARPDWLRRDRSRLRRGKARPLTGQADAGPRAFRPGRSEAPPRRRGRRAT